MLLTTLTGMHARVAAPVHRHAVVWRVAATDASFNAMVNSVCTDQAAVLTAAVVPAQDIAAQRSPLAAQVIRICLFGRRPLPAQRPV
jgi:hypothetical protein